MRTLGPLGVLSRWKSFYFEARNKADNFRLYYYSAGSKNNDGSGSVNGSSNGGVDLKGKLDCFGYQIEPLDDVEVEKYGEHCLKLSPTSTNGGGSGGSGGCSGGVGGINEHGSNRIFGGGDDIRWFQTDNAENLKGVCDVM